MLLESNYVLSMLYHLFMYVDPISVKCVHAHAHSPSHSRQCNSMLHTQTHTSLTILYAFACVGTETFQSLIVLYIQNILKYTTVYESEPSAHTILTQTP